MFISEIGEFMHPCEDDLVCKSTNEKVPYFNAPIFLENKQQIGKVDEIYGPIRDFVSFSCRVVSVIRMIESWEVGEPQMLEINKLD